MASLTQYHAAARRISFPKIKLTPAWVIAPGAAGVDGSGGLGGANRSVGVAPKSIAGSSLVGRRLTFTVAFARLWGWIEGLIQLVTGSVLARPVMASISARVML